MQIEIFKKVLGQIFRHFLTLGAGYLLLVGVDTETNNDFISATVDILVAFVIFAGVQLWGFLQKRYAENLFQYALRLPAGTPEEKVKAMVSQNAPPPVES